MHYTRHFMKANVFLNKNFMYYKTDSYRHGDISKDICIKRKKSESHLLLKQSKLFSKPTKEKESYGTEYLVKSWRYSCRNSVHLRTKRGFSITFYFKEKYY